MTPTTATPTSTVTVSGTVANHSGAAQSVTVQAWSTPGRSLQDSAEMQEFSGDNWRAAFSLQAVGLADALPDSVANGATVHWTVSFPASDLGATALGVFPVAVQATDANDNGNGPVARTFLPFWPGSSAAASDKPLQVSWIWPLIDAPQESACTNTLSTPELAGSVKSGGRLSTLLNVAATSPYAQSDDLTWAIDPALLYDVYLMTKQYDTDGTSGSADCSDRISQPADPAAASWLDSLKKATSGSEAFLTPYANVDAAALAHAGLDGSILKSAYQLGDTVASKIMPDTFGKNSVASGGQVLHAAMPADGQADSETVGDLAIDGGVNTVILSNALPSAPQGTALAKTNSDTGTGGISLLFADSSITATLGDASATTSASSQFSVTQTFLAETALIAAEAPATARSLVIEPPANWDPSAAEAGALLQDTSTATAPWLQPTKLSTLSTEANALPASSPLPSLKIYPGELGDAYMDRVADIATEVTDFKELLYKPSTNRIDQLTAALSVTASSAWRGAGYLGGSQALTKLGWYLSDAENDVLLVASSKILLTGQSGLTSVSVQNEFSEPIEVRVIGTAQPGSGLRLSTSSAELMVAAKQSASIHISVSSSVSSGTTTVHLQLTTVGGTPLSGSHTSQPLSVEVTRVGRLLLIIIGAALGILVLTSVYRVRRKRAADAKRDSTPDEAAKAGGAG